MGLGGVSKKVFQPVRLKKREYDPEIVLAQDIEMPIIYKDMDQERISRDLRSELNTYKSLGYRFKEKNKLNEKEYHSYQIGILINALNKEIDLKIKKNSEFLPKFIYQTPNKNLTIQISDIIKKFDKEVPKNLSDIVSRDQFIWTPIEAGYLLYYLSIFKDICISKNS